METPVVIGVDEAGRGAFFSRIYSAAVVYDAKVLSLATEKKIVIRDSKKMTPRQRQFSYDFLVNQCRFGIGFCTEKEIDEWGISRCNVLSMHRAIDDLLSKHTNLCIQKIHVDGVLFQPYHNVPYELVVRGESVHPEIAMASILAKTHRDLFLVHLCQENPQLDEKYGIKNNKGYGTVKHIEGIRQYGLDALHRRTFVRNHHQVLRFLQK